MHVRGGRAATAAPSAPAPAGSPDCPRRARPRRSRRRRRARPGRPRRSRRRPRAGRCPPSAQAPRQRGLRVEHRLQVHHQAAKATRGCRTPLQAARRARWHHCRDADDPAHDRAGARPLPGRPADVRRRRGALPVRRRLRRSSATATCCPSGEALVRRARRAADVARPERAGHGAGRASAYAKAMRPAPDHGRDVLDRARRHQHGHRRRRRPREPAAAAAAGRRHVREPRSRSVLQQVEHFERAVDDGQRRLPPGDALLGPDHAPGAAARSLPQAVATMLDPADCGPAFLGLPQDVQAEAYDFPVAFFEPACTTRPSAAAAVADAARDGGGRSCAGATRPLIVAGGGVHYSGAELELARVRRDARHPGRRDHGRQGLAVAGRPGTGRPDRRHRLRPRPTASRPRPTSCSRVGTRLQDFTTGSWTVFGADTRLIGLNAARFDAVKHRSLPLQGDARERSRELTAKLGDWPAPADWGARAPPRRRRATARSSPPARRRPRAAPPTPRWSARSTASRRADDYVVAAAGGFPGELNVNWLSRAVGTFDCEYGFSCMGYELVRRLGRAHRATGRRGLRVRRRRVVPDAELRPLLDRPHGAQGDRDRLRQRRLRGHRAPPGRAGQRVVQQHARRPARRTSPPTRRRSAAWPRRSPTSPGSRPRSVALAPPTARR